MASFSRSICFGKLSFIFRIEGIGESNKCLIRSDDIVENTTGSFVSLLVFLMMPFTSTSLYFEEYKFLLKRVILYVLFTAFVVLFDARVISTVRCEPREKSMSASRVNCSEERKLPEDCFADNNERRIVRAQVKNILLPILLN